MNQIATMPHILPQNKNLEELTLSYVIPENELEKRALNKLLIAYEAFTSLTGGLGTATDINDPMSGLKLRGYFKAPEIIDEVYVFELNDSKIMIDFDPVKSLYHNFGGITLSDKLSNLAEEMQRKTVEYFVSEREMGSFRQEWEAVLSRYLGLKTGFTPTTYERLKKFRH